MTRLTQNASILAATSRLFSSTVVRELATKGRSSLFARLVEQSDLLRREPHHRTVGELFDAALASLRSGACRDEYVYKAALTHKILLGKHSLRTACMLNEFRVGPCKADMVILNGTATVYEIKSERDSLSRLETQIEAYKTVFASVVVIAGENHVASVLKAVPPDVGVLQLSRRHSISVVKPATDRPERIDPTAVLGSLRTDEARDLLVGLGIEVPLVPNTQMYAVLREKFERLDPLQTHDGMLQVLKRKRDLRPLSSLVDRLPKSLQPAALSVPLRKGDHDRLVRAVETPLSDAMAWA